jgi:hypothetical protein
MCILTAMVLSTIYWDNFFLPKTSIAWETCVLYEEMWQCPYTKMFASSEVCECQKLYILWTVIDCSVLLSVPQALHVNLNWNYALPFLPPLSIVLHYCHKETTTKAARPSHTAIHFTMGTDTVVTKVRITTVNRLNINNYSNKQWEQ